MVFQWDGTTWCKKMLGYRNWKRDLARKREVCFMNFYRNPFVSNGSEVEIKKTVWLPESRPNIPKMFSEYIRKPNRSFLQQISGPEHFIGMIWPCLIVESRGFSPTVSYRGNQNDKIGSLFLHSLARGETQYPQKNLRRYWWSQLLFFQQICFCTDNSQ